VSPATRARLEALTIEYLAEHLAARPWIEGIGIEVAGLNVCDVVALCACRAARKLGLRATAYAGTIHDLRTGLRRPPMDTLHAWAKVERLIVDTPQPGEIRISVPEDLPVEFRATGVLRWSPSSLPERSATTALLAPRQA
jgi:hypothetical protein